MEPRGGADLRRGFELLDLDGGIGWELLTSMVRYKARQRLSAKAALAHPYFDKDGLLVLSFMQSLRLRLFRATQQDYTEAVQWIIQLMAKSGTEKDGGFTEAQLQELRVSFNFQVEYHMSNYYPFLQIIRIVSCSWGYSSSCRDLTILPFSFF